MAGRLAAIVAMDEGRVFGNKGALPWHLPEDMARFRKLTMGAPVVMGRKTWDSLPEKFRPLPGRKNIVVSRRARPDGLSEEVVWLSDERAAAEYALSCCAGGHDSRAWVIGGAELYARMIPLCSEVFLTEVKGTHEGDVFLPPFEDEFEVVSREVGERCSFLHFRRRFS